MLASNKQFNNYVLFQSAECFRLDDVDFVLVQRQNFNRVQALERLVVDLRDAIVIEVQNQKMVEVLQGGGRHVLQLVLGHVQLGELFTCSLQTSIDTSDI